MKSRLSETRRSYSARGIPTYRVEVWHDGLHRHREIKGGDESVVLRKAQMQMVDWDARWAALSEKEAGRTARARQKQYHESQQQLAAERTTEAEAELISLQSILLGTLHVDDRIDWDTLKDRSRFPEPTPQQLSPPSPPHPLVIAEEPKPNHPTFVAELGFLDQLIPSRRKRRIEEARVRFEKAWQRWKAQAAKLQGEYDAAVLHHETLLAELSGKHSREVREWEQRKADYLLKQQQEHARVDDRKAAYFARMPDAITEYCDMVLSASSYPDYFPKEWDLEYDDATGSLIVEYVLPAPSQIPTVKEVRYIQNRGELVESHITESQAAKLYDSVLYQVVLRTLHELYEADSIDALQSITFNGWVTSINPSTGKESTACLLSLQTTRAEFLAINLEAVEPKACFKMLRGVGSSKLHSLTPIAPVVQMRREDGRFVAAREIANTLDDATNLAAMDWEDFEHLVRELFEQEFSVSGGDVKVTRASRDGGVDAIAFDPDPIRGGKIVIQAKRYTNTVGVAAVRDLYGTVINEGATKGVLVSTSDYGPDAYAFAKDKPLTLLNGSHLLHLLEKHGRKARIDLREARAEIG